LLGKFAANLIRGLLWTALPRDLALAIFVMLPIRPVNSSWRSARSKSMVISAKKSLAELVETIAKIRDSLSPEDRAHLGIMASNYGEAGAVNLYGPQFGLPRAISGVNSFWQRGYGDPPPETVIVMGEDLDHLQRKFLFLPTCRSHLESIWRRKRRDSGPP